MSNLEELLRSMKKNFPYHALNRVKSFYGRINGAKRIICVILGEFCDLSTWTEKSVNIENNSGVYEDNIGSTSNLKLKSKNGLASTNLFCFGDICPDYSGEMSLGLNGEAVYCKCGCLERIW
jgi:hypothetical protein